MKSKLNKSILLILVFAVVLFSVHITILKVFLPDSPSPMPLWLIYSVLTFFALLMQFMVYKKVQKSKGGGAKAFIFVTIFKMAGAFGILMAFMFPKSPESKYVVYHFFISFFPFLLVETLFAIKLINHPFDEKNKNSQKH